MQNFDKMRSPLVRLSLLSVLVVSAAYQVPVPSEIRLGSFLSSAPFLDGFHDAEDGYRWTRTRSCLTFPDPGPSGRGKIELELSGFRPRGQEPPVAILEVSRETHRIATPRRFETMTLPVLVRGPVTTDVELCVRSETFTPGPMDQRSLGIRIGRVRFLPEGGGVPPLGQVALAIVLAVATFSTFRRTSARGAGLKTAIAILALGIGYLAARPYTALAAGPLAALAVLAWGFARFLPGALGFALELASSSGLALRRGLGAVASARGVGIALLAIASVTLAFVARPTLVVELGSGLDAPLVRRFAAPDGEAGVQFRRALAGAEVDLRDFGGGTEWRIAVTASLADASTSSSIALLRAGNVEFQTELGPSWSTPTFLAKAPFGWRSGLLVEFPAASPSVPVRIDRIELDRGRALPSLRVVAIAVGTGLALLAAAAAAGLGPIEGLVLSSLLVGLPSLALFLDPVGFVPLTGGLLLIALLALGAAAISGGSLRMAERRGFDLELAPVILFVSITGFLVWMTALSYPLYVGRHFVYHSNIAEEIWKGKFLVFYLPHPDNILSREAQWGGLVVPYPCLYHTLVAPLTALPAAWFQFAHKLFQATLLTVMSLVAAALAWRFSSSRAALAACIVAVALVPSFQLLGLAHFLTVFGCAMSSLALGFMAVYLERLSERRYWFLAVALTSVAFLSYTASLLFAAIALAAALPFVYRADRPLARPLASATLAAVVVAFFSYYIHWVLPFINESIPILLASEGGESGAFPLFARLAAVPRKLDYSFGSVVIPLAGLAGIGLAGRRGPPGRILLLSWAAIVVVFSGFDLFFNFILKHHYFVMVPVATGTGILASKLVDTGRLSGRVLGIALIVFALVLGVQAAHALAVGTIQ
jgi:hypothetical protein